MSFINDKTKEINCKVIYYGPALSGKTTTLRCIYTEAKGSAQGEMISLSQDDDRTLYFDFIPLNLGKIKDYTVRLHLYTVPGEVAYQQARALISKGADSMVFIADSQLTRMDANLKSLMNLKDILKLEGHAWGDLPCVFQYNKRDLPDAMPPLEMRRYLNGEGFDEYETVATTGEGVMDAFRSVSTLVLRGLKN